MHSIGTYYFVITLCKDFVPLLTRTYVTVCRKMLGAISLLYCGADQRCTYCWRATTALLLLLCNVCSSVDVTDLLLSWGLWVKTARKERWLVYCKMQLYAVGHCGIFGILHLAYTFVSGIQHEYGGVCVLKGQCVSSLEWTLPPRGWKLTRRLGFCKVCYNVWAECIYMSNLQPLLSYLTWNITSHLTGGGFLDWNKTPTW